jgi:hypothetical protein
VGSSLWKNNKRNKGKISKAAKDEQREREKHELPDFDGTIPRTTGDTTNQGIRHDNLDDIVRKDRKAFRKDVSDHCREADRNLTGHFGMWIVYNNRRSARKR